MGDLVTLLASVDLDEEGYLQNLSDWNQALAEAFAQTVDIELSDAHWELVSAMRDFYQQFDLSPAMRPFVKFVGQRLGAEKGKSIYLMQLFPGQGSPVKRIALIAGLPKPDNCL